MATHLKASTTVFALLAFATSGTVCAQAAPVGSLPTKVAIVNIQDALANTNEGKNELGALQTRFAPKQAALKAQNDEVESLRKQLQTDAGKMSADESRKRVEAASVKQKALQRAYEDMQNEVQQAEQELLNRLGKKMLDVLEKYAQSHGYTVVVDVSNPQSPILWAHPSTNITNELVAAYDAAASGAAGASKKP
jgi:outer membrane protein